MTTLVSTQRDRTGLQRAVAAMVVVLSSLAVTAQAAEQASYPVRPIRLIVPYPPGAGTDFTAREVGAAYSKVLGQPVVIDNRPGAAATLGHGLVAKAQPDGYTLLLGTTGGLVSGPALLGSKILYDPLKDFATIGLRCTCRMRSSPARVCRSPMSKN